MREHAESFVAELAEARPELVRLAECLCLAAGVERAFLRGARLRFVPDSTAGLEAELWFSPLVEAAGERMLLLDAGVAEVLRRRLALGSVEFARAVREFTEEAHRSSPPAVRWFEDLMWAGLFPSGAADRIVKDELRRMLVAVTADGGDRADDLGRWALYYLPRLPSGVLGHDDARRIQVAASERLGIEPPRDSFARPSSVTDGARALVQREVPIGVTARSGGVVLSYPPAADALTVRALGGRTVRLDVVSTLVPSPQPALSGVEIRHGQSVAVPLTVLQRLHGTGEPLMSIAHAGAADEVAVAADIAPDDEDRPAAHFAVLMRDGTIVLHAGDGTVISEIPAPETDAARRSLTLSADGCLLAWIEGDDVHQYTLDPVGGGATTVSPGAGEMVSLSFPHAADEGLTWVFSTGGALVFRRPGLPDVRSDPRGGVRATWHYPSGSAVAVADEGGYLWLCDVDGFTTPQRLLGMGVTTVTGHGDGEWIIGGRPDGSVRAWSPNRSEEFLVGTAPWAPRDLAVSADGYWVAAVGGDALLLIWNLNHQGRPPRRVRLAFCAERVFPHRDGGWTVGGEGGPVELRTEDGRRHVVAPDFEAEPPAPEVPPWIRGCVVVETGDVGTSVERTSELVGSMGDIAAGGVQCLAVGPFVPPSFRGGPFVALPDVTAADALGSVAALVEAAERHGVRVVVDLLLPDGEFGRMSAVAKARVYDLVRRWLDRGVGGVRVSDGDGGGRRLLNDLHHLLGGYEERVLMWRRPPAPGRAAEERIDSGGSGTPAPLWHVATSSLDQVLANGIRDATLGSDAPASFGARLARRRSAPPSVRPGFQWQHPLPGGLEPAQRRLAAAVLLSLPGCPALPLDLVREPGTATLLGIRRAHLALSRGTMRVFQYEHPEVLGVLRAHGTEAILCLANSATRPTVVTLRPEELGSGESVRLLDLVDGSRFEGVWEVPLTVTIAAGGVRWLLVLSGSPSVGTRV
ncbi:alpha-glucosidase C-terminal domain-containing protein [Streptomyces sp. NPDC087219]|uniref:alpha-glucosidase C-terminal domain-containing protein n=1 Tax=Streptomyces sp. NPDC087219 TaxID=3365770 RepID=UPI003813D613